MRVDKFLYQAFHGLDVSGECFWVSGASVQGFRGSRVKRFSSLGGVEGER